MSLDTAVATQNFPPLLGVVQLMRRASAGENLVPLGQALLRRALNSPQDANAYMDFSTVLILSGNREHGLAVQAEAIAVSPLYSLPAKTPEPGLRLLVLMGPGDLMANTPVEFLVENSDVELQLLYLMPDADLPKRVPEHDVMMVAVGESEESRPLLQRLQAYVADWPRPIINHPARILELSRNRVSEVLQGAPGIDMPLSVRVSRDQLLAVSGNALAIESVLPDGGFPIIVRPLGSHAGTGLDKIDAADGIQAYLSQIGAEEFYISRFVDYRNDDGLFRKYRVVLIDGKAYFSHFAVSTHWVIHYANAGMFDSAEKRAEEEACIAAFDSGFAQTHALALQTIYQRLDMPYLVIDCAEAQNGDLIVFEVDNSAVVHATDPVDIFPYKQPAMQKAFSGFRALLENARQAAKPA